MTVKADTTFRRVAERGSTDFKLACRIIDEALVCHVGFTLDRQPYVVPMALGRDGNDLLLHGSIVSRLMQNLADGLPCCVTVTHLDGLVLARSSFHSSMNYRSVMVFGTALPVTETAEKNHGLNLLVEHLAPGRSADVRPSSRKELNATTLLRLPIETFTVKQRAGPPSDASYDLDARVWAGVVPLSIQSGQPETAPDMQHDISPPDYLG